MVRTEHSMLIEAAALMKRVLLESKRFAACRYCRGGTAIGHESTCVIVRIEAWTIDYKNMEVDDDQP